MVDVEVEIVELFDSHVVKRNGVVTDAFNTLQSTTTTGGEFSLGALLQERS